MKRLLLSLVGTAAVAICAAQVPDVFVRVDMGITYQSIKGGESALRWYTPLGLHSTVGLSFRLEPGFHAFVSERLQKIANDGDNEQLDEYWIEDPGSWRVGKQYLPFGKGVILRESGRAARGDTNLLFDNFPVSIAICDNGRSRTRGVSGRMGSRVGFSFAVGDNFGIQGTSLDTVRLPEQAPGPGRGYKVAVGLDGYKKFGPLILQAEGAAFRRGETDLDTDTEVTDFAVTLAPGKNQSYTVGWSREWRQEADFFRAVASLRLTKDLYIQPLVRLKGSRLFDAAVSVRVRM